MMGADFWLQVKRKRMVNDGRIGSVITCRQFKLLVQHAASSSNKANPFIQLSWNSKGMAAQTTNGRLFLTQVVSGTGEGSITLSISTLKAIVGKLPTTARELNDTVIELELLNDSILSITSDDIFEMAKARGYVARPQQGHINGKVAFRGTTALKGTEVGILAKLAKADGNPLTLRGGMDGSVSFHSQNYSGLIQQ